MHVNRVIIVKVCLTCCEHASFISTQWVLLSTTYCMPAMFLCFYYIQWQPSVNAHTHMWMHAPSPVGSASWQYSNLSIKLPEKSMEFWQRQKAWEEEQLKFSVWFHTFLSCKCHSKSWWASRPTVEMRQLEHKLRLKRCETTPKTWGLHLWFYPVAPSCCQTAWAVSSFDLRVFAVQKPGWKVTG